MGTSNAQSLLKQSDDDWDSQSFLQSFIDTDPIGNQVSIYEEILKIKSSVVRGDNKSKYRLYKVKGCDFEVTTDTYDNVTGYRLTIGGKCPDFNNSFNTNLDPPFTPPFNSKHNLKDIISKSQWEGKCINKNFNRTFLHQSECGNQTCHLNTNNLVINSTCNAVPLKTIIYQFNDNDGINNWLSIIHKDCGGENNKNFYPCIESLRKNDVLIEKYDRLAEKKWGNIIPSHITISLPHSYR
jgi:hypothetical protein